MVILLYGIIENRKADDITMPYMPGIALALACKEYYYRDILSDIREILSADMQRYK